MAPEHSVPGLLALTLLNTPSPSSPVLHCGLDGSVPELSSLECTRSQAWLGKTSSLPLKRIRGSVKAQGPSYFRYFGLCVLNLRAKHSRAVFAASLHSDMLLVAPTASSCSVYAWKLTTTRSPRLPGAPFRSIFMLTGTFSDCQTSFPSLGLFVPMTTSLRIRNVRSDSVT